MNLYKAHYWDTEGTEEREDIFPALDLGEAVEVGQARARDLGQAWDVVRVEREEYEAAWLQRVHVFGPVIGEGD